MSDPRDPTTSPPSDPWGREGVHRPHPQIPPAQAAPLTPTAPYPYPETNADPAGGLGTMPTPTPDTTATGGAGAALPASGRKGSRRRKRSVQTAWTDVTQPAERGRISATSKRAVIAVAGLSAGIAAGFLLGGDQYYLRRLMIVLLALIIACGLNILVGHTGQVSLGSVALYAVGGYTAAWVTAYLGWPAILGIPVGAVAGGVAGLIVGAPALRLRGAYLALATLAFGLLIFKVTDSLRLVAPSLANVEPPRIFPTAIAGLKADQALYFFILLIAVVVIWCSRSITWSSTGRRLMAVRDSEDGAASVGISVYRAKLGAFVASALIAGVAGGIYNYVDQLVNPTTFDPVQSTRFLFVLVIGGLGTAVSGPFIGATLIFVLQLFAENYQQAENLALAAVLLLVVWFLPRGIAGTLGETRLIRWLPRPYETYTILSRSPARLPQLDVDADEATRRAPATSGVRRERPPPSPGGQVLIVENVFKHYGGIKAVDGVSFSVPEGAIHAIMGPNGSGKTTCLDLIAGARRPDSGRIIINGADVTSWPAHKRERAGLARTFQNIQLFKELPVIWNIAAAIPPRVGFVGQLLHTPKAIDDEIRIHGDALAILEEWDLTYLTFRKAGVCSYGQQKMIELARAAATKPDLLLVDEPSTGLNPRWIAGMVEALAKINRQGTTLLLIEHHQAVIGDLADRVTVLDQGRVIAEGTFDQVRSDPHVQMVYLGEVHSRRGPASLPATPPPEPFTAQNQAGQPPQPGPPPAGPPPAGPPPAGYIGGTS